MYRLIASPEYQDELSQIETGFGQLAELLERSVYLVLQRDPNQGHETRQKGIRVIRQRILVPLLMVQIYYRIDEGTGTVTLISIVPIDMTRM
jgi:hypothetical protein